MHHYKLSITVDSVDVQGFFVGTYYLKSETPIKMSGYKRGIDTGGAQITVNHGISLDEITAEVYAREVEHAQEKPPSGDFEKTS